MDPALELTFPGRPVRPRGEPTSPAHVEVAHVRRGGLVEGVHFGSVVVLAPDGTVRFRAGDVDAAVYPRSAAKPLQAVAMVRQGLHLPSQMVALAAASHSGEPRHLSGVRAMLEGGGFDEADLLNPAGFPYDPVERDRWVRSRRMPSRIAHNCSGKHAALLLTARGRGQSTHDYLKADHPLQQSIAATIEDLAGEGIRHSAVDGCGTPVHALSLRGLARAVGRIASAPPASAERVVADSMREFPEMVAGSRRDLTALMRTVPGLLAKDGFEAVQVAALRDGTAIALKIADGADRARLPVTAAALVHAGVDPAELAPFLADDGPDGIVLAPAVRIL